MKTTVLALALVVLAGGALAGGLEDTAKEVRAGKLDVGKARSLGLDARFHTIHAEKLGLGCSTCHVSGFPADYLLLRKDDRLAEGQPGPVERATCLACHKEGGPATPFYGPSAGR
jgi:hypothetical protein